MPPGKRAGWRGLAEGLGCTGSRGRTPRPRPVHAVTVGKGSESGLHQGRVRFQACGSTGRLQSCCLQGLRSQGLLDSVSYFCCLCCVSALETKCQPNQAKNNSNTGLQLENSGLSCIFL